MSCRSIGIPYGTTPSPKLISNAIKYTSIGVTISVSCKEFPGDTSDPCIVEAVIQDNEIGMFSEFLFHAYELFSRERTTTASGVQGADDFKKAHVFF